MNQITQFKELEDKYLDKKDEEQQLLKLIAEGDHKAFAQIVRRYTPKVYPYLLYWLKNAHQAEDLTQDVFIRLWDKRQKLADVENIGGYIYTTARHTAIAALDKQLLSIEEVDTDKLYDLTTQPAQSVEFKELITILDRAIDALPPRRKEVFLLSRKDEMTYERIAEELGISRSAVRQHMVAALVFLRYYIKQHANIIVNILFGFALLTS